MTDQMPPTPPPTDPPPAPSGPGPAPEASDSAPAMWAHLAGAIMSLLCLTALFAWAPALIIFMTGKDKSKFVAFHSLQALFLYGTVGAVNLVLWCGSMIGLFFITTPLALLINLGAAVYGLVIGLKAKDGEWTEYLVAGDLAKKQLGL